MECGNLHAGLVHPFDWNMQVWCIHLLGTQSNTKTLTRCNITQYQLAKQNFADFHMFLLYALHVHMRLHCNDTDLEQYHLPNKTLQTLANFRCMLYTCTCNSV